MPYPAQGEYDAPAGAQHPAAVDGAVDGAVLAPAPGGVPPEFGYGYAYPVPPPSRFESFFIRLGQRMPNWAAPVGLGVLAAGGVAYTLLADPVGAATSGPPTCAMKLLTGFDCPGCGGTRAAWYMLHGDLPAAARHHAPLVFATPFLIYMYLSWTLAVLGKWRLRLPTLKVPGVVAAGFLASWLVFSVLRNLPWAPFNWFYV